MDTKGTNYRGLTRWLRRMRLEGLAAFLLEAMSPMAKIGAQAAYIIEPLAGGSDGPVGDLARLLEEPDQLADVIDQLGQEECET